MKTSELTGAALDWAVAKCEDKLSEITQALTWAELSKNRGGVALTHGRVYSPSTDWAQGGPIIEREQISIYRMTSDWSAAYNPSGGAQDGPTALIAAMRCHVTSKLGDEVEIPVELQ